METNYREDLAYVHHAGYDAVGVDASPEMVRIARETAPGARFVVSSVHDFPFPPCDAVTAIGETLSYLPPGAASAPPLPRLFRRVARALRPGGLFVFDVLVASGGAPLAYRTWREGDDWAVLVEVREEPARRRLVREIATFRRVGDGYRRARETHELRVLVPAEVERELRAAGFTVRTLRRYGAAPLAPRRLAFRARKTGAA